MDLPYSIQHMLHFIAFCFSNGLAASTTLTYVSALGYQHKVRQLPDPSATFIVKKCLQGYHRFKSVADVRLPITPAILLDIVRALNHVESSHFSRLLFKAMFLLAFHAFLRVGEITVRKPRSEADHVIQYNDISWVYNGNRLEGVELQLRHFKHSKHAKTLFITCRHHDDFMCPVHTLWQYCTLRRSDPGELFVHLSGAAVSRAEFALTLQRALVWVGLPTNRYKSHSFRIGAASTAASMGISDDSIQLMGRWSSNAHKKYIRIPILKI